MTEHLHLLHRGCLGAHVAATLPLHLVHLGHSHRPTSAGRMVEHLHLLHLGHLMRMWQRPHCTLYTWDVCRRVSWRHHWGDPLALPGEFMLRQTLAELGVALLHDADVAGGASETLARERHRQNRSPRCAAGFPVFSAPAPRAGGRDQKTHAGDCPSCLGRQKAARRRA